MHFHSSPYFLRGLRVGVDVSHPAEHHWNPESTRLLACLFCVDAPKWPKLRTWTKLLVSRQVSPSAAEVHMPMPGRYAQRRHCVQLCRGGSLRCGVHHADSLHALRGTLIKNRSRLVVVRVLLLKPCVAKVGVVHLFAYLARGMKRFVTVSQRGIHIGVAR